MSERDETREAVARAIYDTSNRWLAPNFGPDWKPLPLNEQDAKTRRLHRDYADAVLKLFSPGSRFTVEGVECVVAPVAASKAMVDSGVAFALNVSISSDYNWSSYVADLHSAMLRACEEKGG